MKTNKKQSFCSLHAQKNEVYLKIMYEKPFGRL